jgi:hypothetical protein
LIEEQTELLKKILACNENIAGMVQLFLSKEAAKNSNENNPDDNKFNMLI